eukprot:COSAG01_NODE_267_length_19843_cov_17.620948_7_plen_151_part_00
MGCLCAAQTDLELRCQELGEAPWTVHHNVHVERTNRHRRRRIHDIMLEDHPDGSYMLEGNPDMEAAVPDAVTAAAAGDCPAKSSQDDATKAAARQRLLSAEPQPSSTDDARDLQVELIANLVANGWLEVLYLCCPGLTARELGRLACTSR